MTEVNDDPFSDWQIGIGASKTNAPEPDNRLGVEWKWTFGVSIEDGAAIRLWSNALEQSRAPLRLLISALE